MNNNKIYNQNYRMNIEGLMRNAAEEGSAEAQYLLGLCYNDGYGVEQDDVLAFEWNIKAAEQDYVPAQVNVGSYYYWGGVFDEAVHWWNRAAQEGDAEAQFKMGECYEQGVGVKQDEGLARRWWLMAAEQGYVPAQEKLCVYDDS
eukprot:TRINITY_DN934_c0_g1_i1.p1 TRINITY_DN934_c0_g1~~TRINITY_DN934_c0_g1_i1.p1  ORF type:complete len:145 (+),score=49.46 TRINITY_DN934_c0_g1_i1:135-569(+)